MGIMDECCERCTKIAKMKEPKKMEKEVREWCVHVEGSPELKKALMTVWEETHYCPVCSARMDTTNKPLRERLGDHLIKIEYRYISALGLADHILNFLEKDGGK